MSAGRNMIQMQQEAAERVKRMQERSRRLVQEHPVNVYRGTTVTPSGRVEPPVSEPECLPPNGKPKASVQTEVSLPTERPSDTGAGLASLLQGDREQTLVLLLAVILAKNGAPLELVLALLYVGM